MASPFSECLCIGVTAFIVWFAKDEAYHRKKDSLLEYEDILGGTSRASFTFLNVLGLLPFIGGLDTIGFYFASLAYEIQKATKRHEMGDHDKLKISANILLCIFCIYLEISAIRRSYSKKR
jgi:hypothetical protein